MTETSLPFFDGHNDTLLKMLVHGQKTDLFFSEHNDMHLSLPKAVKGNLIGGLFAVCVPTPELSSGNKEELEKKRQTLFSDRFDTVDHHHAYQMTMEVMKRFDQLIMLSDEQIKIVRTVSDLNEAISKGLFSVVIHFEGAEQIDASLDNLESFYEKGLRSLGVVWSRPNVFGHGIEIRFPGSPDNGHGLTDAGKELVKACNRLGIMVDLSHMTEKGFWDVAGISNAPLVASHSCVFNLCNCSRNLTDKQLDAIGESNGLVGINFAVQFLRKDGKRVLDTPAMEIVRHIKYIADRIGPKHVAIGSDFDGATIPNQIGDAAGLQNLTKAMQEIGFNREEMELISYKNWVRIFSDTWK